MEKVLFCLRVRPARRDEMHPREVALSALAGELGVCESACIRKSSGDDLLRFLGQVDRLVEKLVPIVRGSIPVKVVPFSANREVVKLEARLLRCDEKIFWARHPAETECGKHRRNSVSQVKLSH